MAAVKVAVQMIPDPTYLGEGRAPLVESVRLHPAPRAMPLQ